MLGKRETERAGNAKLSELKDKVKFKHVSKSLGYRAYQIRGSSGFCPSGKTSSLIFEDF